MGKFYLLLLFSLTIGSTCRLHAQLTQLEIPRSTLPAVLPAGPTTAAQTATLLRNSAANTFVAYTPAITATFSLSNQQYTNVPGMNGVNPGPAMQFGIGPNLLGTSAAPLNTWYPATGPPWVHNIPGAFTANPAGPGGTGVEAGNNNYSCLLGFSPRPQQINNSPLNGRFFYGRITITFNRPVANPVIHVTDLGAFFGFNGQRHGFSADLELDPLPGTSISLLSGNSLFAITPASRLLFNNSPVFYDNATDQAFFAHGSVLVSTTTPITSLSFSAYIKGDLSGNNWEDPLSNGTAIESVGLSVALNAATLSGTVFNDVNGLTDNAVGTGNTGTNAGGLNAVLIDPGTGNVIDVVAVAANGTYAFNTALAGVTPNVIITTNTATVGSPAPAIALPAGWVSTGEFVGTGAGNDGTVNATLSASIPLNANLANANFGIEQVPNTVNNTAISQINPGGTISVPVPATTFSGTDVAPGTLGSIRITAFPTNATSITINGTTYTSVTFPVAGVTVPATAAGNPTQLISVDPLNGIASVVIPYTVIDNAGREDPTPGAATVPFTTVSISGTVFNDPNGLTDLLVNGTGTNTGGLNAVLVDPATNTVIATVPVAANGMYTLNGANAGNNTVLITTSAATVDAAPPAIVLPASWVTTGEGIVAAGDGTPNSTTTVTVTTVNVTGVNFGIERGPTALNELVNVSPQPVANTVISLNGTQAPVPRGSDPDDQPVAGPLTGSSIQITSLPVNGVLRYQGTPVTTGADGINPPSPANPFVITNLATSDLSVQLTGSGYTSIAFNFTYVDGAGMPSAPASYTLQWSLPLPVTLAEFTVKKQAGVAVIQWITTSQINVSHFELQRSADGITWKRIYRVEASNTPGDHTYTYTDLNPLGGVNIYRLKTADIDNTIYYSGNVSLWFEQVAVLQLYPNPASGYAEVRLKDAPLSRILHLRIYDMGGRLALQTNQLSATGRISLSGFMPGIYNVLVSLTDGTQQQVRLMIEK